MNSQDQNPADLLRIASWMRQAAGMTPRSAALRYMRRSFQFGGPRLFKNHDGARSTSLLQDHRAMQPMDMTVFKKPDTLRESSTPAAPASDDEDG